MYKITFKLKTAISFVELPTFDSILAYCYMREKYDIVQQKLTIDNVETFDDLPIVRHKEGYFLASWLQFNPQEHIEFTGSWKKRWANQQDFLADFGKKVRKVRISAGDYKSYDMPIVLHHIKKVWFYFVSNDIDRVRVLVSKHLWGIGKKTSQGYGEIDSFEIETIDYNPFEEIIRPIPANMNDVRSGKSSFSLMGWKPPYWLPKNQTFCINPK